MAGFLLWCILFVLCWPLALLALIAYPFVWLISLPFRIIGITLTGVFGLLTAIFLLPVRLLRGPRVRERDMRPAKLLSWPLVRIGEKDPQHTPPL